jgi:hypothetical protein
MYLVRIGIERVAVPSAEDALEAMKGLSRGVSCYDHRLRGEGFKMTETGTSLSVERIEDYSVSLGAVVPNAKAGLKTGGEVRDDEAGV